MTDAESLQRAIHEDIRLQPYDPAWPLRFAAERDRLATLVPQFIEIEHIGSTAIDGLLAKPVIDIMAGVTNMLIARSLSVLLCNNNYTTSAEFNASLTDRQWFMRWADGHRTHHLHVVLYGGKQWQERLRFRDALRTNAEVATRYTSLKQQLSERYEHDREAYTVAKTAFVQSVVSGA